jgi:uncharacterized protein with HEPN domain
MSQRNTCRVSRSVKYRDQDRLADIAEAAEAIELYLSRGTLDIEETYYACRARLMEIGEAVAHLSPALTSANANIPWRQIAGMRNVLIHDYDDVSFAEVAGTIDNDLPALYTTVLRLIEQEPSTTPREHQLVNPLRDEFEITPPKPPLNLDHEF